MSTCTKSTIVDIQILQIIRESLDREMDVEIRENKNGDISIIAVKKKIILRAE